MPPSERDSHGAPLSGLVTIEERAQTFNQLHNKMTKRLHQAAASKLAIMTNTNKRMVELTQEALIVLRFKQPATKEEFVRTS